MSCPKVGLSVTRPVYPLLETKPFAGDSNHNKLGIEHHKLRIAVLLDKSTVWIPIGALIGDDTTDSGLQWLWPSYPLGEIYKDEIR